MTDCREELFKAIRTEITNIGLTSEQEKSIESILLTHIRNYTVEKVSTEIVVRDNTIDQLIKLYVGTKLSEGKSRNTTYAYEKSLYRFFNQCNKPLKEINVFDIRTYLSICQQNASLRHCENERLKLSGFFKWLYTEKILPEDIACTLKAIKYQKNETPPFTPVEIDTIRSSCTSLRRRAEIEVLLSSGLRCAELCALNRNDIDFSTLKVNVKHGKGNKQRYTYINDVAKKHLLAYLNSRTDDDECMFYTRLNGRLTDDALSRDLKRIQEISGVDNIHAHRFRHTFATNCYKSGMDIVVIQALLGHTDINVTKGYITADSDYVQSQVIAHR